jgi:hypothetical protein
VWSGATNELSALVSEGKSLKLGRSITATTVLEDPFMEYSRAEYQAAASQVLDFVRRRSTALGTDPSDY